MNWVDGIIIAAFASGAIWGFLVGAIYPAIFVLISCIFSISIAAQLAERVASATGGSYLYLAFVIALALFFGIPLLIMHRSNILKSLEKNIRWVTPDIICNLGAATAGVLIVGIILSTIFIATFSLAQGVLPVWFLSIGGEIAVESISESPLATWEIGLFVWFAGWPGVLLAIITCVLIAGLAIRSRRLEGRTPLHALVGEIRRLQQLEEKKGKEAFALAISHFHRAMDYEASGRYDEAIVAYSRAIELDRKNFILYLNRGISLVNQGKIEDAITDFQTVITMSKDIKLVEMAQKCINELKH